MCTCAPQHISDMWRLEDNFQELVLSFAEAMPLLWPLPCCTLWARQSLSYLVSTFHLSARLLGLQIDAREPSFLHGFWELKSCHKASVRHLRWLSYLLALFWSLIQCLPESQADLELALADLKLSLLFLCLSRAVSTGIFHWTQLILI